MASLALGVRFTAASSGTGDFVVGSTVQGYNAASAKLVDGKTYRYRSESPDLTQWEWGTGVWTSGTSTLTRATIDSSSTGSKVSFSAAPQVSVVIFPSDVLQFDDAMSLTSGQQSQARGNLCILIPPQGRLTLVSATPVMSTTQSAVSTIYYTPTLGNQLPLYDGTNMVMTEFSELSASATDTTKSPAAIGTVPVDWFVWNDSGTLRLSHGPAWTDDATRSAGSALTRVKGVLVNNTSITNGPAANRGTWVGTTRSFSANQFDWILGGTAAGGNAGFLGVWNSYNRVRVSTRVSDSTDSWSYATATWRSANNSTGMRIYFVSGDVNETFEATYHSLASPTAASAVSGVGFNSTSAYTGITGIAGTIASGAGATVSGAPAICCVNSQIGLSYVQAIEALQSTAGTCAWYGDAGTPSLLSTGILFKFQM